MSSSSELSEALNPYYTQPRRPNSNHSDNLQPVLQSYQQHVPHRSELELALAAPSDQNKIHELFQFVAQTQENERKRRLAWEQEQEERYARRQAELERQMMEMRREILTLRSAVHPASQYASPAPQHVPTYSPISPSSDLFVQGSSTQQQSQYETYTPDSSNNYSVYTTPMSPQSSTSSPMLNPNRISPMLSTNEQRAVDSEPQSPAHGRNHYQRNCRSIQEAMRRHILRLMQVEGEQLLPSGRTEGSTCDTSEPVRFVWDKTTKQSVHNTRMKEFVLEDIKLNRRLYSELPDKDFSKNILESAFESNFTTLRQNFKAQRDSKEAENVKRRGDQRAQNARRLARRKKKLNDRAAARSKIPVFEHVAFDGALQIECMSSEESDDEADTSQPKCLYTRGFLWRSNRLLRFFNTLDQEDSGAPNKRGSAKMDRAIGVPKEGIGLPPKGVSRWMISRRWMNATKAKQPDLEEALARLVVDESELPLETLIHLGEESEEEEEGQMQAHMSHMVYSSSLQNALA